MQSDSALAAPRGFVNPKTLDLIFSSVGFTPPENLKAVVLRGHENHPHFDFIPYAQTAQERETWWPASTVKYLAATAALEAAERRGLSLDVSLEFFDEKLPPNWTPHDARQKTTLKELIQLALIPSDNVAFDRLIHWVGFDELYAQFLNSNRGFDATTLMRGYSGLYKTPDGAHGTLRTSPAWIAKDQGITLMSEKKLGTFQPKTCGFSSEGNCTTVFELAVSFLKLMRPQNFKTNPYALSADSYHFLQETLKAPRPRGMQIVNGIRQGLSRSGIDSTSLAQWVFAHKPGFAADWMSDVVYVENTLTQEWWVVSLAAFPGREALTQTAETLGNWIGSVASRQPF